MKKIYLAGGWFTPEMEEEHTRIYNLLKDDFDVFNPRIKGELFENSTGDDMSNILIGNIEGMKNADIIVMIYDRKDTGTIWESGFSYCLKKPIIYYAETLGDKKFNLMLAKTGLFAKNEKELFEKLLKEDSYKFKDVYHDFKGTIE